MFDEALIVSSFAQQYGIRLLKEDISVCEYRKLLSGINGDTPLGYVVKIRSENDPEKIKEFSENELKIRSDWQAFKGKNEKQRTFTLEDFERVLRSLAK